MKEELILPDNNINRLIKDHKERGLALQKTILTGDKKKAINEDKEDKVND